MQVQLSPVLPFALVNNRDYPPSPSSLGKQLVESYMWFRFIIQKVEGLVPIEEKERAVKSRNIRKDVLWPSTESNTLALYKLSTLLISW